MKGNKLFLIFSLLGYALALLTTEKAIMFPGLIILYIVCFKTGLLCSLRSLAMTFFPFFIITFLYGLTLISRIPERIAAVNPSYGPTALTYNPILQVSTAVSSYLELFIVPLRLTFYHDTAGIGNLILAFMIILTAAFIITTVYLFRKNKLLFFGASFFVISISPTLIPISVGWVVAERYFYLGSLGLCIMLAYLILKFKKHSLELLTLILAVYFILTLYRNTQWKNEDALWPVTLERSPGVPVAHNNMGDYYARRGDYINAIKEFSMAVSLRDGLYPEAMHNLGNSYRQVGDLKKAEELYLRAIELKPDQIESYLELSSMYKSQNDLKKAEEYYQKAFQLAQ